MKPIPAIVESDIARHATAVDQALSRVREAEQHAEQADRRAQSAHEAVRARRLELGRVLAAARKAFPSRGPNARAWTDFLSVRRLTLEQAQDAMKYAGVVEELTGGFENPPAKLPTRAEAGLDAPRLALVPPANVIGGSGETARGAYCTPKKYALAVGPWDLDPFSNPRSHVIATFRCMLEDGGNGIADDKRGSYRSGSKPLVLDGNRWPYGIADENTRVWLQPPYSRGFIARVVAHYGHARFCALLRFAPDTDWFAALWPRVAAIAVPRERLPFETPDGVEVEGADESGDAGAPFPHVFYYADERDITPAIRELCIVLRVEH